MPKTRARTNTSARRKPQPRKTKRLRTGGTAVVYPRGVQEQLGISLATRWRMEKEGRLPPRDFLINGVPVGWRPATLEAAFSNKQPGQPAA